MEKVMDAPASSAVADRPVPLDSEVEVEISKLAEHHITQLSPQNGADAERIRSSVARLTSSSIDGLEALSSELHALQKFLKTEVERVQKEIESALAGIDIIMETISPWKNIPPLTGPRAVRAGPAANIEVAHPRR
jgi:hypothetical protein